MERDIKTRRCEGFGTFFSGFQPFESPDTFPVNLISNNFKNKAKQGNADIIVSGSYKNKN